MSFNNLGVKTEKAYIFKCNICSHVYAVSKNIPPDICKTCEDNKIKENTEKRIAKKNKAISEFKEKNNFVDVKCCCATCDHCLIDYECYADEYTCTYRGLEIWFDVNSYNYCDSYSESNEI